jgi:Skp family chaperone for outer membrane proteins
MNIPPWTGPLPAHRRLKLHLAALAALLPALAATTGCAQSKSWKGGDACSEIGKIQQRLQERLGGKTPASDEESETLTKMIGRLHEERRDLQRKSQELEAECDPQDTRELDDERRRRMEP